MKHTSKIDMRFKYTTAAATDIRRTFDRVRRELREKAEAEAKRPKATIRELKKEAK